MSDTTNITVITTAGHLALQETTRIHSTNDLKRGEIIKLKAARPVNEQPYGWAEVLVVEADRKFKIRRFN